MRLNLNDFSIKQIAESGQCFRIRQIGRETWFVPHLNYRLIITELGHNNFDFSCSIKEFEAVWINYFDLNTDYSAFKNKILMSQDDYLIKAIEFGFGIRILRQDLFEVIISFILSQNSNITKIRKTIQQLTNNHNFPSQADLAQYSIEDFQSIGAGYRSKYLYDFINSNFDLYHLKSLSPEAALKYLQTLNGVGPKVANCIALFALHHMSVFPRDVWINRIIAEHYSGHFDLAPYHNFAGLIQQYMFYYERNKERY